MRAFGAMLIDAYRELNSRRMFWITLVLSALAVSVLLILGLTENHTLKIVVWDTKLPMPPDLELSDILKGTYISIGVKLWLTWAATILALISTASIMPDFISGGSIDLVLCKPIARVRLFLIKYICGLLFVALQVAAFSIAAFAIIGVRSGDWLPGLFLAIPLVVAFFSYLYCICALVGLITRSTIAALLLTILFWLVLFSLNFTDNFLMMPHTMYEMYVEKLTERVAQIETDSPDNERLLKAKRQELEDAQSDLDTWDTWHGRVVLVKTLLPKTGETIKLLERSLTRVADMPEEEPAQPDQQFPFMTPQMYDAGVRVNDVAVRMEEKFRQRTVFWVLGTSLLFEGVVLGLACVIFVRRDF